MILFRDPSALVKPYLLEDGSDTVASRAAESEALVVCDIRLAKAARVLGLNAP